MELSKRTKKKLNEISSYTLGSNSLILCQKAQQYDVKEREYWARKWASFIIRSGRTIETAAIAAGRPSIEEFKNDRIPRWFIGKYGKQKYSQHIDDYINMAQEWNVIEIADNSLCRLWKLELDILSSSGNYLRELFTSGPIYSRKGFQVRSLILLQHIHEILPKVDEIDLIDLGLEPYQLTRDLSRLEAMSVIKRLDDGRLIPQPAIEIHGETAERKLQESLEEPLNRHIFQILRKMPGVSFTTLLKHLDIPITDEVRSKVFEAIKVLRSNNFIITVYDCYLNDVLLLPLWVCYGLTKNFNSTTVIHSDLLKEAIRACSKFWEGLRTLGEIDSKITTLIINLKRLLTKKRITVQELVEMGQPYSSFILNLRTLGIIKQPTPDYLELVPEHISVLDVMFRILTSAYRAEIESERVNIKDLEKILKDLNSSLDVTLQTIAEKLSSKDFDVILGLK